MDKAREQHNVLMDKGREQLTAFGVSCYNISIIQEIYASLIMYNFSERIASCVVIGQANGRKYIYQVNFAIAAYICRLFYRSRSVQYTNLLSDISRYIEPVRKGRANGRKLKRKPVVNFIYRVA